MRFGFYARLRPALQAVYRESDNHPAVTLPAAPLLRPLADALAAALETGSRTAVEAASGRLLDGLAGQLRLPPVRTDILAVRPRGRSSELHGLYTPADGGRPAVSSATSRARIQLWMRTARQRRVVAFRTFLRTLLHEFGHHYDYAGLGLADSLHTEGFYKRESSLFHQLVPDKETVTAMPTADDYARQPISDRIARLGRTPDEVAAAIAGRSHRQLAERPDAKNWCATEIVCHLRDTEELFQGRFQLVLAMDAPAFLPIDPDRWASERQYQRCDPGLALEAFRARRRETLELVATLGPAEWARAGVHPQRGRVTLDAILALVAGHDDNHLAQLGRAVEGRS